MVIIFYLVYEFIKNVVGDKVDVFMLIKVGIELYDFELLIKNIVVI